MTLVIARFRVVEECLVRNHHSNVSGAQLCTTFSIITNESGNRMVSFCRSVPGAQIQLERIPQGGGVWNVSRVVLFCKLAPGAHL